jgi:hypothetical protein
MSTSILELGRMTADSEHLIMPAIFQRAFKLATVAYCSLVVKDTLPDGMGGNQNLQLLLGGLQRLSDQEETFRAFSADKFIPPYLEDYARNLRRQFLCDKPLKNAD